MRSVEEKFLKLGVDNAPGQEGRQKVEKLNLIGEPLKGPYIDFSHGDVDAFEPIPGVLGDVVEGIWSGGIQAYTEYRGRSDIREELAKKLSDFIGVTVDGKDGLIITPGTQGALFLAMGATFAEGDKVAIIEPDYFANRKLVEFFGGEMIPVSLHYKEEKGAGLDLSGLEEAFKNGVKVFLFSNPNNPTGVVYSGEEIKSIGKLAKKYNVMVIADELYSRQIFENRPYAHLYAQEERPEHMVTIIGPSKTESLSGYRLGVAFGDSIIIARMEKLQAIVSLRAPGYSQAALHKWFAEPEGWMKDRIQQHQDIRDELISILHTVEGLYVRPTEAGSYLFPELPEMKVGIGEFCKIARLHANAVITPGTEFGPQFTNSFRINFSQDRKKAKAAIERIVELIKRYRK